MGEIHYGAPFQATTTITEVGNTDIVAAVSTVNVFVQKVILTIYSHADTGTIAIDNGTTEFVPKILAKDDNGSAWCFDFGARGYNCGLGNAVRLVNGTDNVSAGVTIMGYKRNS